MRKVFAAIMAIVMVLTGSIGMAMGVEVEENLFSVEITIPADLIEDMTQEKLDTIVAETGIKSGTFNEDGSITYVMSKKQHEEILAETKASIDAVLVEMIETNEEAAFVSIEANDDYTEFKVVLSTDIVGLVERFSALGFYIYGFLYNAFAGTNVENIAVVYINQATGEVIETLNWTDMEG